MRQLNKNRTQKIQFLLFPIGAPEPPESRSGKSGKSNSPP